MLLQLVDVVQAEVWIPGRYSVLELFHMEMTSRHGPRVPLQDQRHETPIQRNLL